MIVTDWCGHPPAARAIVRDDSTIPPGLRTQCWACAVQAELVAKIVGPAATAKRRECRRNA